MVAVKERTIVTDIGQTAGKLELIIESEKDLDELELPDDTYRFLKSIPPPKIDGTKEYLTIQYKALDRFKYQQELLLGREMTSNEVAIAWATSGSATKFREQYNDHYENFVKICERDCHHECKGPEDCAIHPIEIEKAFEIEDVYKNIDYCNKDKE